MGVEAICGSATDVRALRPALVEEIRRSVPFRWYAWLLTDPVTTVGASPLADVPCLPELPQLIRLKYSTPVNRWTTLTGAQTLGADPARSLVWRELQSRFGVVDVASLVFADRFGVWGFLDLWRDDAPFRPEETDRLNDLTAPVTAAIRRCLRPTFTGPATPVTTGPVVLVLGPDLTVQAQTADTDAYLRALVPPDKDRSPIPAGAYNVGAQLLAAEAGVDDHPPRARVHLPGRGWLALRAAKLAPGIAVTVEACPPLERADLYARVHGLTPRESEVLLRLAAGDDTRAAARSLQVSDYTVQDHLKAVFAKTGAHDRRMLLAAALGT